MGPQDIASVINTVASEVGPRLAERRMQLVVERPDVSPAAWCDERAVGQVLRNLITNAVHYSPESTSIGISLHGRDAMLEVRVADRGIGVPEDERETIFGEFVQSSKTLSGAGGTGLGLAICRRIVRRHGGRIWVEPQPDGIGSIFAFTLPREARDIAEEN
jgi:signal transduction histidine kinase